MSLLSSGGRGKAAVTFILVTVMLDMLAFGIIIPVLPQLIIEMSGGNTRLAADWNGWLATGWAIMQFFWSPILGTLSDRFGRRPIILISNFGLAIDFVLLAIAPDLWWLLAARLLSGAVSASISTSNAYIADVTPPQERAKAFGMISAAFGVGFVIGPGLGGLLGSVDPRLPFWGAAGLAFINGLYGLFVLPESLPHTQRTPFSWAKANPVGGLQFLLERPRLFSFGILNFTAQLGHFVLPSVFVLYAMTRYGWGAKEGGIMMMLVGACSIVVQGFLTGRIVPILGERRAVFIGYGFGALGMLIFALASQGWMLYAGIIILSLWGIANPSLMALATRHVEPNNQGKFQGMTSAIGAVAGMIGPLLYSQALKYGQADQDHSAMIGLPFYIAAGFLLLCVFLSLPVTREQSEEARV
jgi:MFS transporter, DHA1 family, tetracycline resistance protein